MQRQYFQSILWIAKLQWQTSRFSFGWSVFNSAVTGLLPIAQAFVLANLVSSVSAAALQHASPTPVYVWLTLSLVLELVSLSVNTANRIIQDRFQQKMHRAISEKFFYKMYELSQEQFDNEEFHTKLDRAQDSLHQIWRVVNEISWAASALIGLAGSIIAILVVSPIIGLIIVIATVPIVFLQVKQNILREAAYKKTEPYDRIAYRSRWMLIDPATMPEIRLMNAFKQLINAWRTHLKKSQDLMFKTDQQTAKLDIGAEVIQPVISFGASLYFFKLLLAGTIGLDRFIFLRSMLTQASNGAVQAASSIQRLHELMISLRNFSEIYDTPPAIPNGQVKIQRPLTIEFKDVSFTYPGATQTTLKDVSFVIAPGSKLAIVGENGAGKTTLIKLLLRQYLPTKGTITINGTNIQDIEQESYYAAISNLSQDFLIVQHLSIKENLTLGLDKELSDKTIYDTTDLVDATGFIKKLPHKLSTRLDTSFDDGVNLSGGQNQRLGVARALLRKGDIMILDEPTSAIDAKAEYTIFNNIYKSHADRTTLIVSHRFSTVRKADYIIVMEQGTIVEYGTHHELMHYGKLYKEMFDTQAEGYKD
jgi:ABC-type multidrug transport system fused ATPase/permease subunit